MIDMHKIFNLDKSKRWKMIKTAYFKPIYKPETFELLNRDCLVCTIKDIDENKLILKIIPEPKFSYYIVKEEYQDQIHFPLLQIEKDKVLEVECKYKDKDKDIFMRLGLWNKALALKKTDYKQYLELVEETKSNRFIYSSDVNIEDYYKTMFELEYGEQPECPLRIGAFDIENDIYENESNHKNPVTPITVITFYVEDLNTEYIFALDLPENEGQQKVKQDVNKFIANYLKEEDFPDPNIKFVFKFLDSEVTLLREFFKLFHDLKLDYIGAWNSPYDVLYIINRCKYLGLDPAYLWCPPEVPDEFKRITYYEDRDRYTNSSKPVAQYWDWLDAVNYTMIIDSMSLYANFRKRRQEASYSLYHISNLELGISKVDLSMYGLTIRNAHVKDYARFLHYAIMDTYLLFMIMKKSDDLQRLTLKCTNSRISKGTKVSILIKNELYKRFLKEDTILGNSINYPVWNSIDGAVVADPLNNIVQSAKVYGDRQTKIYDNIIDMDATSLYPYMMIANSICKNTIDRRYLSILDEDGKFLMSGEDFIKALQTKESSIFDISQLVFNLPSAEELIEENL